MSASQDIVGLVGGQGSVQKSILRRSGSRSPVPTAEFGVEGWIGCGEKMDLMRNYCGLKDRIRPKG